MGSKLDSFARKVQKSQICPRMLIDRGENEC